MLSYLLDIVKDVTHDYIAADDRINADDKEAIASIIVKTISSGIDENIPTVLRQLLIGDATFFLEKLSDDIHEALFQKTKLDFDNVSLLSQGVIAEINDAIYGRQSNESVLVETFFEKEVGKINDVFDKVKNLLILPFSKKKVM